MRCSPIASRVKSSLIGRFLGGSNSTRPVKRFLLKEKIGYNHSNIERLHISSRVSLSRRCLTVMSSSIFPREGKATCFPNASRGIETLIEGTEAQEAPVRIECVSQQGFEEWLNSQVSARSTWIKATNFKGSPGDVCLLPSSSGGVESVLFGTDDPSDIWTYAALPSKLPPGVYALEGLADENASAAVLGWIMGTYTFDRYKTGKVKNGNDSTGCVRLVWPSSADKDTVKAISEGIFLARDMITTPAEDMTPQDIAAEAAKVAAHHGSSANIIKGDDLIKMNFPAIHTVGRASINPPHLVDFRWAPSGLATENLPKVTLVGKGVSFDTGGLDLKPANAMKLMKKDMGGSALMLGLAHAVMACKIPVALRVLIPTVENSVSDNAYRPLDVLQTRAGITVENGNTDAEGRLILCDALAEAAREKPDLLLDAATLTGAARVALGTELPALFCSDDSVANDILSSASTTGDMLWRMPLHKPYRKMLESKVADIGSCSEGGYGGAITAALFLQEFVEGANAWAHIDTMGYNLSSKPGRPEGGEALALRALFAYLHRKYASNQ